MKAQANSNLLADLPASQAIVRLALPATVALLAKAVYNIVDTAYIGMLGSDLALTAVGVTLPLLLIMVSLENIFAAGAGVLAGRQLGADDKAGANRTVTTIIGISMLIGIILCLLGILYMEPLLKSFVHPQPYCRRQKNMHFGCLSLVCLIFRRKVLTVPQELNHQSKYPRLQ